MSLEQIGKKEERALRILEALSGVDEELLERSEKKVLKTVADEEPDKVTMSRPGAIVHRFVQKHGRALAACLCLCVLGTAFWGMRQLAVEPFSGKGNSSKSTDKVSTTGMAENKESAMENPAEAAAPESALAEETMEVTAGGTAPEAVIGETEGGAISEAVRDEKEALYGETSDVQGVAEPVWIAITPHMFAEAEKNLETDQGVVADGQAGDNKQQIDKNKQEAAVIKQESSKMTAFEELSWEEAGRLTELGAYVPDGLPDGYEPVFARRYNRESGSGRLTLLCSNGEKNLWLNITETDWTADMFIGLATPVLMAKEDWRNQLPEPDEDGGIQFGLLFENGVLVEYQGYLTREEISDLFSSMQ